MFTSCGVLGTSSCARPRRSNSLLSQYEFSNLHANSKTLTKVRALELAEEERFELSLELAPH